MLSYRLLKGMKGRLLAHPVMLTVGAALLVSAHVIFFLHLHRAGMSLVVVTGLGALVIAKHLGLLAPLYSLLRSRPRTPADQPADTADSHHGH